MFLSYSWKESIGFFVKKIHRIARLKIAVVLRDLRKFLLTISNKYHNSYYIGTIWFVLQET